MNEIKQLYAIVHGRVQGVSFRYYTVQTARTLGLTGWVRNLPDGTVEVLAEGPCPPLEQLLAWLHEGSPSAVVKQVRYEWRDASGEYRDFRTRYFND